MLQAKKFQSLVLFFVVALVQFWGGGWAEGQLLDTEQVTDVAEVVLDPNRVLARVGDEELLGWQAELLMGNGLGGNLSMTVNEWIRVLLRDKEARRQGIQTTAEEDFQFEFREKYNLGVLVFDERMKQELPEITDAEVRVRYEETIEFYVKPMVVKIQHIMVPQKVLADTIAAEARKPEIEFDSLVEQWARGNDVATKGYMIGATYEFLVENLGSRVAEAIRVHNGMGIVNPVMGTNGYEVIKVHEFTPGLNRPFEEVKEYLRDTLRSERYRNGLDELDVKLESAATVFRSEEVKKEDREPIR